MSLNRLAREVAQLEPTIRRAFETSCAAPSDPFVAMLRADAQGRLRPQHVETLWQARREGVRARLIVEARDLRSARLAGTAPAHDSSARKPTLLDRAVINMWPYGAAIETLSYLPEECPPEVHSLVLLRDNEYSFIDLADMPVSMLWVQKHIQGVIAMRILGTADGMELREEIWGATATRTAVP